MAGQPRLTAAGGAANFHATTRGAAESGAVSIRASHVEKLWDHRLTHADVQAKALSAQLVKVERQVSQFLERVLDASVPSVIAAYEDRIAKLEQEKLVIKERMANVGRSASSFDDAVRTALEFISSPCHLWNAKRLDDRRAVLKLTFADKLRYLRNEGFRTA